MALSCPLWLASVWSLMLCWWCIANQVDILQWGKWEDRLKLSLILLDPSHGSTIIGKTNLKCLLIRKWKSWYEEKCLYWMRLSLWETVFFFCLCYGSSVMKQFLCENWAVFTHTHLIAVVWSFTDMFLGGSLVKCFFSSPLSCSFKLFKIFSSSDRSQTS